MRKRVEEKGREREKEREKDEERERKREISVVPSLWPCERSVI